ncbi:domain containing protein, partial [Geosmithia morbida]
PDIPIHPSPKPEAEPGTGANGIKIPPILPHERVFPIQIGGELFKLSGASISSDAPSYFSQYFACQIREAQDKGLDMCSGIKTLYIDRDPETFRDIALHLQGYHVTPRDGTHFVRLFADAQFYNLPKLNSQLYEENIFITIGHREFQVPRNLFSDPGNTPNFFTLGFAAFFSNPDDLFPGLDRKNLIRPPSIVPPSVPNRSGDTFAELLHLLRGYPLEVRGEAHRETLARDARYFHFKGLEQKLVAHSLSYNPSRRRREIAIRLEAIQKRGISVVPDLGSVSYPGSNPDLDSDLDPGYATSWVWYARPFVDDQPAELVVEIGADPATVTLTRQADDGIGGSSSSGGGTAGPAATLTATAVFSGDTAGRVARLLAVVGSKMTSGPSGPSPLSEQGGAIPASFPPEAAVVLDGVDLAPPHAYRDGDRGGEEEEVSSSIDNPRKRRRVHREAGLGARADLGLGPGFDGDVVWTVKKALWRVKVETVGDSVRCVLVAVKVDAVSSELGRNMTRTFL